MLKLTFETRQSLGIVTLNNPPVNAIGLELVADFQNVLDEIERNNIRGLIFRAEGENFSAGADVNMFAGLTPAKAKEVFADFFVLMRGFETLPFPTMAVVQGLCLTAGLEAALTMDMIWAADSAVFSQAEAIIGAIPFGGGIQRLTDRAGAARAKEIVFSAQFYPSQKFLDYHIINRVLPAEDLLPKAEKFMQNLAENGPTLAFAATKEIVDRVQNEGIASADLKTQALGASLFDTEDLQNGVASFLKDGPGKITFQGK